MDYEKLVEFPVDVKVELEILDPKDKNLYSGVKLIVQSLVDSYIGIITLDNKIPSIKLNLNNQNTCTVSDSIFYLAKQIGIHQAYIDNKKIVCAGIEDDTLFVYYTFMCPREFINEKNDYKIISDFSSLSLLDSLAVREAIQLLPSL